MRLSGDRAAMRFPLFVSRRQIQSSKTVSTSMAVLYLQRRLPPFCALAIFQRARRTGEWVEGDCTVGPFANNNGFSNAYSRGLSRFYVPNTQNGNNAVRIKRVLYFIIADEL